MFIALPGSGWVGLGSLPIWYSARHVQSPAFDIFSRPDIGGFAKFLWLMLILFLPIIGMLIYFIARPDVFVE
jgi:hypothetical protein